MLPDRLQLRTPLRSLERIQVDVDNESTSAGARSSSASSPTSDFRVTTTYDDDNSDEGDGGNGDVESDDSNPSIAEIERINLEEVLVCPENDDSDVSDNDTLRDSVAFSHRLNDRPVMPRTVSRAARRRADLRRREQILSSSDDRQGLQATRSQDSSSASSTLSSSSQAPAPPTALEPHAHFFIERGKSMVSIKFDPPPYGILFFSSFDVLYTSIKMKKDCIANRHMFSSLSCSGLGDSS